MRKIKFRIWDKINRMWFKRFNVNLLNIGDLQNVEMMQYTGIKDKNVRKYIRAMVTKFNKYFLPEAKEIIESEEYDLVA